MKSKVFVERAILKHGNKYDYSLVTDAQIKEKSKIICPTHGIFEQRGDAHLSGQGCGKCGNSILKSADDFIIAANKIHKNKYNYDFVNYINCKIAINIICPIHGFFKQTPDSHLSGHGCKLCSSEINAIKMVEITAEQFINKAIVIHNNKYKYPNVEYINAKTKINIHCKKHGEFEQTPNDHLSGKGCSKCGVNLSIGENDVRGFIENELNLFTDKIKIDNKEIDIYVPPKKVGIEYDGLYFHSVLFKGKKYHQQKTDLCEKNDIQLLHIFEDEWANKKEIVKSIIKSKLGIFSDKIFARKCTIREINSKESAKFLVENHLQGNTGSSVKIGLYYNNELVSVMTLGKKRISMGVKTRIDGEYELIRFCNKQNTLVIGGASKLLNYFIKTYNPKSILTFADRRYSNGNLYKQLGFTLIGNTEPNYFYFKQHDLKREYRFKFRKDILIKNGFDASKTEHQIMEERGYFRIYDCGSMKFEKCF
jgi:hypothetical protein